jgi:hypothetical protein
MLIPRLQKGHTVFDHQRPHAAQLVGAKTVRRRKTDGFKPEFSDIVAAFNMHMRRLRSLETIEEKPVPVRPQYCRHFGLALSETVPSA